MGHHSRFFPVGSLPLQPPATKPARPARSQIYAATFDAARAFTRSNAALIRARLLLVPLALCVPGGEAAAQDPRGTPVSCEGRTISEIAVTPREPTFPRLPRLLQTLVRGVDVLHTTTKEEVIGRFLLLQAGERCTERQRAESERVLRLQPFLAGATVRAVADGSGGVRIEVETIDEIPTVLGMRFRGARPSAVRFGNGNVGGQGLYLSASVKRGFVYRTGIGVAGAAYQAFGRPWTLTFTTERAPLGGVLALALAYPFLTDLQRTAWHAGGSDAKHYVPVVRPEGEALSLAVRRRFWDLGAVRRLGRGHRSAFLGVLLTEESVTPAARAVVVADSGLVEDTSAALGGPVRAYRNVRLNAVLGVRALSFVAVRGFDALTAVQDVASGVQLGTLVGRSTPRSGANDDDLFISGDLYAGLGSATSFAALRIQGEGRQNHRQNRWDSMVGSGRLAWYLKPAASHVLISSIEFAGGWRNRIPFQLRLGDRQGGVRGYAASRTAGAVRTVARMEERWLIGGLTEHFAVGLATFVDAGRVWAGDAPFGVDSRTKFGLGTGLLVAFPPQSQRLWRLDLAIPASADRHAGWELRLTGIWTRTFWREPGDVARGRAGAAPSTIFIWP